METNRLESMANALKKRYAGSQVDNIDFLGNIFSEHFDSVQSFVFYVQTKLKNILKIFPEIKLLVIDSAAGIFRVIDSSYVERASIMREQLLEIERLANIYNFAIVTTNHVTSVPNADGGEDIASLGVTWGSMISSKLMVKRTAQYSPSRVHLIETVYSPYLPDGKRAKFIITEDGIEGCEKV